MKIALVAELLVLGVFVMNLADEEGETASSACNKVRQADHLCCQQLERPGAENRDRIMNSVREYVDSLDLLIRAIETDKEAVECECHDLIEDKPRGSRYMTVDFDYYGLLEGFNWTQSDMASYLELRRATMDKWVAIDKLLDE